MRIFLLSFLLIFNVTSFNDMIFATSNKDNRLSNHSDDEIVTEYLKRQYFYRDDSSPFNWEIFVRTATQLTIFAAYIYLQIKMNEEPGFKVYQPGEIKDTFASVAGNHEAKEALSDIVEYLKNPTTYNAIGAKPTTGILLTGAPGTGKTLLARALAGEANCAFIYASGSEFNTKYVGSGVARIKKLFEQAKNQRTMYGFGQKTPCIIFIDEIEVLARQRGIGDNYGDQSVNELLTQLDGFVKNQDCPIIVLAATNYPEKIDAAVTRPGRIDRTIHIGSPSLADRVDTLKLHLQKVVHEQHLNLHAIAQRTIGFTGAELAEIIHSAARIAVNRKATAVAQQDLEEALDVRTIGIASKQPLSKKEREIVAYHEAGHALMCMLTMPDRIVNKITILPRGQSLGVTHFLLTEENVHLYTLQDYQNEIAVFLGGRAAEEIIFNIVSTGPSNDLERATQIAHIMTNRFGMGTELAVETNDNSLPSSVSYTNVNTILKEQYERTKQLLRDNIQALHKLTKALLEKETLLAKDVAALRLLH